MHVALLYHGKLPVARYGGTERVVVWLARGLAELGHKVSLLAAPGSKVPEATLVPVDPERAARADFDPRRILPAGVDILHAHRPLGPSADLPIVWTLHGNAKPGQALPPGLICLSANHAARHGTDRYVYNGLDPADYAFSSEKGGADLFLGRLHSAKGYQWAIEGTRLAGQALVVAGGWRPSLRRNLRFVGEVGGEEKRWLLAEAPCLWMPALWDEPFGLTLIEAMASGTPVLGTRRGALPEIVPPEAGALADTLDELVELRRTTIGRLVPEACRAHVLRHFTHLTMASAYVAEYEKAVGGR